MLSKKLAQRDRLVKGTDTLGWRWKYQGVEVVEGGPEEGG